MIHITILNTCVLQAGFGEGLATRRSLWICVCEYRDSDQTLESNLAYRFLTGAKSRFENRKNFFYRLKMAVVLRI